MEILAHRGASAYRLENSLASFRLADQMGADVLETDVRLSVDREVVLFHDPTVDRIADTTGRVDEYTLEQLRSLPYRRKGTPTTLREFFAEFPVHRVNIDIKSDEPGLAVQTGETIITHGAASRTVVGSFSPAVLKRFRQTFPQIPTSLHPDEVKSLLSAAWLGRGYAPPEGACCLQIPLRHKHLPILSRRVSRTAHSAGLSVHVWTINTRRDYRVALRRGADGIFTDVPDRARAWFETIE